MGGVLGEEDSTMMKSIEYWGIPLTLEVASIVACEPLNGLLRFSSNCICDTVAPLSYEEGHCVHIFHMMEEDVVSSHNFLIRKFRHIILYYARKQCIAHINMALLSLKIETYQSIVSRTDSDRTSLNTEGI